MTSQPEDDFVRLSASLEAEVRETEEDLFDDLSLQETLLESLRDTPQDTLEKQAELKSIIKSIKVKLKKLHNRRGLDQPSSSRTNSNSNHKSSRMSAMNPIDLTASAPPSPRAYPQPAAVTARSGKASRPELKDRTQDRKRTYSRHLDAEEPWLPGNKSRRTTPTLGSSNPNTPSNGLPDNSDASSTVDGDEESFSFLDQQRQAEERYRLRKEQEEDNAWWAQEFQRELENDRGQPAEDYVPANSFTQQSAHSRPNAFDRILNRGSQSSQPMQETTLPSTTSLDAGHMTPSPVPHRAMTSAIPSHIRVNNSSSPAAAGNADYDQTQNRWDSPPIPGPSLMPGSFNSDPFNGLFGPERLLGGSPEEYSTATDSDLEISGMNTGPRPGTLYNGSSNILNNGPSNPGGRSLNDIIHQTNNYDFSTGLDQLGNPIPANSMDFVRSLQETQSLSGNERFSNEDIRDLLANIPIDAQPDNQADTPDGFKYSLYLHQKIALKWMQNMEADEKKKGGILADDMGLGKTISTLALISTRPATPDPGSRYANPTLIVAPVSLIKQWERETMTKIESGRHSLAVLNAHDPTNKNKSYLHFKQFDIVLTTYDKLSREARKFDDYVNSQAEKQQPVNDDHVLRHFPFMGPRSMFHRIVLDEAQAIKNAKSLRFKACRRIQATHRWCLTGTPMMNGVEELSPLINFLRIKPYNDTFAFKNAFACLSTKVAGGRRWGQDTAMKKLQTLLKAIMLRRTKQSEINGQPIIQLLPKVEMVDHVVFGEDEDSYYRDLERDAQVKISRFLKEGLVGKRYTVALVLLLRLRQACCHPFLHITDLEFVNNDLPVKDMLANAGKLRSDAVQRIIDHINSQEPFECPICYDSTENPSILLCGHHTCSECLIKLRTVAEAQNIQAGNDGAMSSCPECREAVDLNVYLSHDIFKQVHMEDQYKAEQADIKDEDETDSDVTDDDDDLTASEDNSDEEVDERGNLKNFIVDDDDDSDFSPVKKARPVTAEKRKKTKRKHKGKGKKDDPVKPHELGKLRKEAGNNQIARKRYMNYLQRIWLDSAKITKCTQIISGIQDSGEKTIVFSQWTLLLDLLELQISKSLRLGYRRYDGSMSSAQRDAAVTGFTNDPNCKVMLISLKAGNAGLNLTMASHVIIMDPFWNPFIEQQAVDRAHRIGQTKEVKVHRVLVKETVEDRIVELQDRKRDLVNAALDENAARAIGRLSANDLAFLFGVGRR
ncbi:SNF2 family domain-containing protein [Seiridium cupressi]